jgi:hypothetical protein
MELFRCGRVASAVDGARFVAMQKLASPRVTGMWAVASAA